MLLPKHSCATESRMYIDLKNSTKNLELLFPLRCETYYYYHFLLLLLLLLLMLR